MTAPIRLIRTTRAGAKRAACDECAPEPGRTWSAEPARPLCASGAGAHVAERGFADPSVGRPTGGGGRGRGPLQPRPVWAQIPTTLLAEMGSDRIEAVICRAPEFSGPGKTQSLTNSAVFDRIAAHKRPFVPLNAHAKRSLIGTPDASRAGRSVSADASTLRSRRPRNSCHATGRTTSSAPPSLYRNSPTSLSPAIGRGSVVCSRANSGA